MSSLFCMGTKQQHRMSGNAYSWVGEAPLLSQYSQNFIHYPPSIHSHYNHFFLLSTGHSLPPFHSLHKASFNTVALLRYHQLFIYIFINLFIYSQVTMFCILSLHRPLSCSLFVLSCCYFSSLPLPPPSSFFRLYCKLK
jgi:hypothetical protein